MFVVYEYVLVQGGCCVAVFEAFRVDAKRRTCMARCMVQLPPEFDIPLNAWRRGVTHTFMCADFALLFFISTTRRAMPWLR